MGHGRWLPGDEPQARYDRMADLLRRLAVSHDMHREAEGDQLCSHAPLCLGQDAYKMILTEAPHTLSLMDLITVAVAQYNHLHTETVRLTGEVTFAQMERDDASRQCEKLHDELIDTSGRLADALERLAAWDGAADVLGPVGTAGEPE